MRRTIRFYLDADLSPKVAVIGRGLGLDVVSAHEVGMTEAADADQLARAAAEGRVLVTRNRDDFLALTLAAYHDHAPHRGLLLVREIALSHRASRLAHALGRWAAARKTVASYQVNGFRNEGGAAGRRCRRLGNRRLGGVSPGR